MIFDILSIDMSRLKSIFPALLAICLICACTAAEQEHRREFLVFGTLMEVTLWGADSSQAREAFDLLQGRFQEMHRDWHAWEPGQLTEINRAFATGMPSLASDSLIEMTRHSQEIERLSEGRFNPAIGALVRLWGFHTSEFPIEGPPPARSEIEALLVRKPSTLDIRLDGMTMQSDNPAVQLDFGGIAKGYAIDIACRTLKELGIDNAIVNAGGDLRAFGGHGDRPWRVAVRKPGGGIIGSLETGVDEAVFTSGNYERFRQDNERRYPHILDPRTGWPVQELASVTVIAGEGWLADAAATALIVSGPDEWAGVARSLGIKHVLVVDENGKAFMTPEMEQRIDFMQGVEKEIVAL